ncbi:MAG: hypothetical protein WD971_09085, partial [Pirellulales bacterium]
MAQCKSLLVFVIGFLAADCLQPAAAADTAEFEIRDEAGNVLVASDQIRSYDLATHTLTLLPQVRGPLCEKLLKGRRLVSGVPFAVVVGGTTVYQGTFTTSASSRSFSTPIIVVDPVPLDQNLHEDQLQIQLGYPTAKFFTGDDPRADERIRTALAAAGKLASNATDHTAWVAASLLEMQAIKPGMTRGDLLNVFKEEGGLSTRTARRYAYRDCPYIKVDVKFDPVGTFDDKLTN